MNLKTAIPITEILEMRFLNHMERHKNIEWKDVKHRLEKNPGKYMILSEMKTTGGEPDIIGFDDLTLEYLFCDCSPESPKGRRSLCYDQEALINRKKNKPKGSVIDMVTTMGIELLTESQYRHLQDLGDFDLRSSSWIKTPASIRDLGGALFCDRRYDQVFMYHNGADSYYDARGFRGLLRI